MSGARVAPKGPRNGNYKHGRYTGEVHPTDSISLFCTDLRVFEVLSRADYFQTLKLTQAFNDKALSLAAELAVIRTGLSK